jgi:hypothetical protein
MGAYINGVEHNAYVNGEKIWDDSRRPPRRRQGIPPTFGFPDDDWIPCPPNPQLVLGNSYLDRVNSAAKDIARLPNPVVTQGPTVASGYVLAITLRSGKVFLLPGSGAAGAIYDPVADTVTSTSNCVQGSAANKFCSGCLLPDGRVFLGQNGDNSNIRQSEIYDPVANTWQAIGSPLSGFRRIPTAVLGPDGKVRCLDSTRAYLYTYDPVANTWTSTSTGVSFAVGTAFLLLLPDGRYLLSAGTSAASASSSAVQVYDPTAGTFTSLGKSLGSTDHIGVVQLHDGRVLILGISTSSTNWIWDPVSNTWKAGAAVPSGLAVIAQGAMRPLADGRVVAGTYNAGKVLGVYDPDADSWALISNTSLSADANLLTMLPDGSIFLAPALASGKSALVRLHEPVSLPVGFYSSPYWNRGR